MAMPMASGKAIARPAMAISATSKRFAALKMNPPNAAEAMLALSAAAKLFKKLLGPPPIEPSVMAQISDISRIPAEKSQYINSKRKFLVSFPALAHDPQQTALKAVIRRAMVPVGSNMDGLQFAQSKKATADKRR